MEGFAEYLVSVSRDEETGQVVAEIPTLQIADYGLDSEEALARLRDMTVFHLEALAEEGIAVPVEGPDAEGLFIQVRLPAHAA